jgi:hypothetical protein
VISLVAETQTKQSGQNTADQDEQAAEQLLTD